MIEVSSTQIVKIESNQPSLSEASIRNVMLADFPDKGQSTLVTGLSVDAYQAFLVASTDPDARVGLTCSKGQKQGDDVFYTSVFKGRVEVYPYTASENPEDLLDDEDIDL